MKCKTNGETRAKNPGVARESHLTSNGRSSQYEQYILKIIDINALEELTKIPNHLSIDFK